ncbi:hypothetical protein [Romboutsia sp.]|uniref:hypothetical protein n=1 Tax=Romboutsia sp. TaxID=1965302 RepID=UPI003F3F8E86
MRKQDNIKILYLSSIGLGLIIAFLLNFLCRLVYTIMHTFVYLTGLMTVFFMVLFCFAILAYLILKLYRNYNCWKRNSLTGTEKLVLIIKSELIIIVEMVLFILLLTLIFT